MTRPRPIFLIAVVVALAACATALPHLSPMQAQWAAQRWPDMDEAKFEQARSVYIERCSSCHNVVPPKELSLEKWKETLDKMTPRAKLNSEQKEMIWRYISAVHDAPSDS